MRIISKKALREFSEKPGRIDSRTPLEVWHAEADRADWPNFAAIKERYKTASAVGNDRVVFNIGGNKYWAIVRIDYSLGIVFIRFVGTHAQYDQVNASEV